MNTKLTLETTHLPPPKTFRREAQQDAKIWYVGFIQVNELKPNVLTLLDDQPPPTLGSKSFKPTFFSDFSAFFSLCNGYFSQTQSLPKLNTLDLSLVCVVIVVDNFEQGYYSGIVIQRRGTIYQVYPSLCMIILTSCSNNQCKSVTSSHCIYFKPKKFILFSEISFI